MQRAVEAARGFVSDIGRIKALLLFFWYVALCTMHARARLAYAPKPPDTGADP